MACDPIQLVTFQLWSIEENTNISKLITWCRSGGLWPHPAGHILAPLHGHCRANGAHPATHFCEGWKNIQDIFFAPLHAYCKVNGTHPRKLSPMFEHVNRKLETLQSKWGALYCNAALWGESNVYNYRWYTVKLLQSKWGAPYNALFLGEPNVYTCIGQIHV